MIRAGHSGLCLDVPGGSHALGVQVATYPCHGGLNQRWVFLATSNGYSMILNRESLLCLNVYKNSVAKGAAIVQWSCNVQGNNQFKGTKRIHAGGADYYQLHPRHAGDGKCLNVAGAQGRGAKLVQWACNPVPGAAGLKNDDFTWVL